MMLTPDLIAAAGNVLLLLITLIYVINTRKKVKKLKSDLDKQLKDIFTLVNFNGNAQESKLSSIQRQVDKTLKEVNKNRTEFIKKFNRL